MRKFLASTRPTPAMAVAFVALLAALSGTAIALPGKNSVDSGDIKKNTVRSADIRNGTILSKDINRRTRAALRGQTGPAGPQGAQGDPGAPATRLWARVSGAGALLGGSGAVSVTRTAAGRYNVTFNQDVSTCAWVSTSDFREIGDGWGVDVDHGKPPATNMVRVLTSLGSSGATADQPFDVAVFC